MNNLHISLTDFINESRVLKETSSLLEAQVFEKIYVAALHADGLENNKKYDQGIYLHRFALTTRKYGKNLIIQLIKYVELFNRIYFYYRNKNISCINVHCLGLLPLGVVLKFFWNARLVYDTH